MFKLKNNLKDWRFWYKLLTALIIIVIIFEMLIRGIIHIGDSKTDKDGNEILSSWSIFDKEGNVVGYDYLGYVIFHFSFFTIQSNLLVAFWLLVGAFWNHKEGSLKLLGKTFSINVVTFITITALIFNFMLLPQILAITDMKFDALWWIEQTILHTLGPLAAVIYFLFFFNCEIKWSFKEFIKKVFPFMLIYPLCYMVYAMLRGEMIYRSYGSNAQLAQSHGAYPYFFLEIHNNNVFWLSEEKYNPNNPFNYGIFWFFIAVIIIIGIMIGLGSLYLYIAHKTSNIRNKWVKNNSLDEQKAEVN